MHGTDTLQSMHDGVDEQQNRYKAELGTRGSILACSHKDGGDRTREGSQIYKIRCSDSRSIYRHRDSNLGGLRYHLAGTRRADEIIRPGSRHTWTTDERPAKIELDEEG